MTFRLYDSVRRTSVDFEPLVPGQVSIYVSADVIRAAFDYQVLEVPDADDVSARTAQLTTLMVLSIAVYGLGVMLGHPMNRAVRPRRRADPGLQKRPGRRQDNTGRSI